MIQTEIQKEPVAVEKEQDVPRSEAEVSGLDTLVLLAGHKRFIVRFVLSAAALATLVAFLLPVRYEAKVLLLPPQQNSSVGSALLGQLGNMGSLGSLAALAGAVLVSRTPPICIYRC